jgi:hypothetical protein
MHTGIPTPWSEACVYRFESDDGSAWIGNLQPGYSYATKIVHWESAKALIVIVHGATYVVHPDAPDKWTFIDELGIDCTFSPAQDVAVLATYEDVVAIAGNGTELWRRRHIAVDGVVIQQIVDDVIRGAVCIDSPEKWYPFAIWLADGKDTA